MAAFSLALSFFLDSTIKLFNINLNRYIRLNLVFNSLLPGQAYACTARLILLRMDVLVVLVIEALRNEELVITQCQEQGFKSIRGIDRVNFQSLREVYVPEVIVFPILCC